MTQGFQGEDESMTSREALLEDALISAYDTHMKTGHDLKTPLTIINGVVSLMRLEFGGAGNAEIDLRLNKISNEIKKMASLIDDSSTKILDKLPSDLHERARARRRQP